MVLSLDIGGTSIRAAEISGTKVSKKSTEKTPKIKRDILFAIENIISKYKRSKDLCVALAGFDSNGKIKGALNIDLNGFPLKHHLEKKFRVKVYIQNDARCAALAELKFGFGRRLKNFIFLTLGTGVGGAVVIDKKLYLGSGAAGEVGSMQISDKILENLASGSAAVEFARDKGMRNISNEELNNLASSGNATALEVYDEVGYFLGVGLANLAFSFAPDAFIFGGGFSEVKHFFPEAKKTFGKIYKYGNVNLLRSKFGNEAGLIGAALLPTLKKFTF